MRNELTHSGVLGMKWGIRRYQNEDGSYTAEGKKRRKHIEAQERKKSDYKNRGGLTNAELETMVKRLQLEKQVRELTESEVTPAKTYVNSILKDIGKRSITSIGTGAALYGAMAIVSKSFNLKDFGAAMFNGGPKKK